VQRRELRPHHGHAVRGRGVTLESVIACCCATPNLCCPFTTLSYATGAVSIEFDQIIDPLTNPRRFVSCQRNLNASGGVVSYTPARLELSANLRGPTTVQRVGSSPSGAGGRCAYRAIKTVPTDPPVIPIPNPSGLLAPNGQPGLVISVPVGEPLSPTNPNLTILQGSAGTPIFGTLSGMRVWLAPFFLQITPNSGTYWIEAGFSCGSISVGTVTPFPFTGCPLGLTYGPGQFSGNMFRGRIRRYDLSSDNSLVSTRLGFPSGSVFDLQGNPLPNNNYPESSFSPSVT
jgi:hypothetical protein